MPSIVFDPTARTRETSKFLRPVQFVFVRHIASSSKMCYSYFSSSKQLVHIPPATKRNNCLTFDDVNQSHTLHGWLIPKRKVSKDLQFLQLRDSQGNVLQLCTSAELPPDLISETPVAVTGTVRHRP